MPDNKNGCLKARFVIITRRHAGLVWLLLACTVALPAQAAPTFPYSWADYSVVPILFSPTDWDVDSTEVLAEAAEIRTAMNEIQQFYHEAYGGKTFRLEALEVVQGNGAKEAYHIQHNGPNIYDDGVVEFTGNFEAAVIEELYSRGYPVPPGQNEDGYSVLIFVKGAGGYAGARELGAGDGGWGILGDWFIDSVQGDLVEGEYWWSGRRPQIGAAAHELGHTFGLPHPDFYGGVWETTIMGSWGEFPNVGLNPWETDFLNDNKGAFFFTANVADFNLDEQVDQDDLARWKNAFGTTAEGDTNSDGDTDGHDLLVWQRNFAANPANLQTNLPVPEPSSGILLIAGILFTTICYYSQKERLVNKATPRTNSNAAPGSGTSATRPAAATIPKALS